MPSYAHTDMFTDMFTDMGVAGVGDVDAMGDADRWVTRVTRVRPGPSVHGAIEPT